MTAALPFAGFGALGGAAFNRLNKTRKPKKVSLLDDRQENILELLNQAAQGQGPFAGLTQTDPEQTAGFFNEAVAQPLINQFNEEILPGITGQFRGKGLGQSTFAGQAAARGSLKLNTGTPITPPYAKKAFPAACVPRFNSCPNIWSNGLSCGC